MSRARIQKQYQYLQRLLRDLRLAAGLHQSDLAERLGQTQSFISKYESGERRLDLVELKNICKELKISLTDFVRRFEQYEK